MEAFSHFECETTLQKQSDLLAFIVLRNAYSIDHILDKFIRYLSNLCFTYSQPHYALLNTEYNEKRMN